MYFSALMDSVILHLPTICYHIFVALFALHCYSANRLSL